MQGIGIGESDFKILRSKDLYYIDKTLFIKHILDNSSKIALITRQRRFGKILNSIMKDLVTLNLDEFKEKFKILVMQMFSYMDVGRDTVENFYHAFVLGMLVALKDTYVVNSNRESGMGRYDIMLEPKDKNANSFIMEFKVFKQDKEKDIEETIANAKKQIEEKQYEISLKERGFTNITKMVFAFDGKDVKIEEY